MSPLLPDHIFGACWRHPRFFLMTQGLGALGLRALNQYHMLHDMASMQWISCSRACKLRGTREVSAAYVPVVHCREKTPAA